MKFDKSLLRRRKRKYGKNGKGRCEGDTTSGTGSPRRNRKTGGTSSADV